MRERVARAIATLALALLSLVLTGPCAPVHAQGVKAQGVRIQFLTTGATLYLLYGGGGNSLALIRNDGVVLLDSKQAGSMQEMLDAIALVTDQPVTTVINTHAHLDHIAGNAVLPDVKEIVAHENAAAAMKRLGDFGPGAKGFPTKTVGQRTSLYEGRERIDLYYFGTGHTDGDLVAVLPGHGIALLGDLFPMKAVPTVDVARGGSALALPDTLARVAREIKGIDRVVAGHDPGPPPGAPRSSYGEIPSWRDFEEYAGFVRDFVDAVRTAAVQGKTPLEARSSLSLASKYPSYDLQRAPELIDVIYAELKKTPAGAAR